MKIFAALFFVAVIPAAAQTPQVPHKMDFAGITLTIRDDARREIQKDVDALTVSPRHYNIKAERAKTYFPIIEKIFAEEQVPDDFKYLVLQESALIADAVSVSNAVGFWQFKDFTALEMGLRVDKEIDERMNIVSSTRAAARYLKKNNSFFDNWIYALQAYQSGAGGVMKAVKDTQSGARHMDITSKTYWYVKKYLAHKIAYEPAVKGKGSISVLTLNTNTGKSLSDIAKEVSVDEAELRDYNKWTKSGSIPGDRSYTVIIPVTENISNTALAALEQRNEVKLPAATVAVVAVRKKINGIQTIQALAGETSVALATRGEVELAKFLQWNDLKGSDALVAGNFYFLGKKRRRAVENFHKLLEGETLWEVSQRYGVRLKRLKKFNRIKTNTEVGEGTMLWLASTRPKSDPVLAPIENAVAVSTAETFNWEAPSTESGKPDTVTLAAESVVPVSTSEVKEEMIASADSVQTPADNIQSPVVAAEDSTLSEKPVITETITVIPKKEYHTVQPKETLYGIARLYNVGVMDLVKWNDLDLQQGIKPGQQLRLSEKEVVAENTPEKPLTEVLHEVKSSDTLYSIARQYGVTIKQIMDWNEKKDFSLAVGEKLRIQQR